MPPRWITCLKPFTTERFRASLDRVRARLQMCGPRSNIPQISEAITSRAPGELSGASGCEGWPRSVHVIPAGRTRLCRSPGRFRRAAQRRQNSWLKQQTISSLEAALDPRRFLRLHRSYLVNVERMAGHRSQHEGYLGRGARRRFENPREPRRAPAFQGNRGGE